MLHHNQLPSDDVALPQLNLQQIRSLCKSVEIEFDLGIFHTDTFKHSAVETIGSDLGNHLTIGIHRHLSVGRVRIDDDVVE